MERKIWTIFLAGGGQHVKAQREAGMSGAPQEIGRVGRDGDGELARAFSTTGLRVPTVYGVHCRSYKRLTQKDHSDCCVNLEQEVHSGGSLRKWLQKSQKTWWWPGLGFRSGGGRLGALGFGMDANGSTMRWERKTGIKGDSRFVSEQPGRVVAEMRNNARSAGLEKKSRLGFWTC